MENKQENQMLGQEKISKLLLKFSVPCVMGLLISALYNIIDQIFIVVVSLVCNMTLAHYGGLSKYGPDIPISVFSIQTKVYTVVCNIVVGIVLGGQPIFGYNYGARNFGVKRR